MKKICPRCRGRGKIVETDPFLAVFSLGITALIDASFPTECEMCGGDGLIENYIDLDRPGRN